MTENLSFYEGDHSSNLPQIEYVDILAQPTWQEFCDEAKQVEFDISDYDPNDDDDCIKVGQRIVDLTEKIGNEHLGMRATVIGMGYANYAEPPATPSTEPFFINTTSASFHGVNVCFFEGKWQTMLEVYCAKEIDETPLGHYNLPLDTFHLMTLNIDSIDIEDSEEEDEDEGVVKNLHEDFDSTQAFVYGIDFTSADPQSQRMLLDDICMSAEQELPRDLTDREVVIACARYFTAYDDMHFSAYDNPTPGFDLRDFLTDLSDTTPEERYALNGIVVGFEYPELKTLSPDDPLSALDMNDGAYCLVLRSDKERATHYILPQTITDIY